MKKNTLISFLNFIFNKSFNRNDLKGPIITPKARAISELN